MVMAPSALPAVIRPFESILHPRSGCKIDHFIVRSLGTIFALGIGLDCELPSAQISSGNILNGEIKTTDRSASEKQSFNTESFARTVTLSPFVPAVTIPSSLIVQPRSSDRMLQ